MSKVKYSPEFKQQAVELIERGEQTITDLAKQLNVRRNQLYLWRDQYRQQGVKAFKKRIGRLKLEEQSQAQ